MTRKILISAIISCSIISCSSEYSRDGLIEEISECETAEELKDLLKEYNNPDFEKWLREQPETDVLKIANAASAKTRCFWIMEGPSGRDILRSDN